LRRRSLLFNSAVYVVGQFATKALAFVLLIIYARFLELEDFGITGTLSAYGSVLGVIFMLGLHGAVGRHYFDLRNDPAELKSYVSSVYAFQLAFAVALALMIELFGERLWLSFTSGAIDFSYVRLMLWATLLTAITQIPQSFYQAEERAAALVGWQLAQSLLILGFGLVFVGVLAERAWGVLVSQLVAAGLFAAALVTLFVRRVGSRELHWRHVRMALLFALPLLPHVLGTILMQTVDRIMLEKYADQSDVGLYSIAMTLGLILSMIAGGVNQAWAPHFFRTSSEEAPAEARKKAETFASLFVAMFSGMALVGALLGNELLYILGEKYLPVLPYLIPFVIGNLVTIYYFLPSNQLLLAAKTRWFVVATGFATVVSVGLNVWILPRGGGGMAAVWIFVIASSVQTGITFLAARWHQKPLVGQKHGVAIAVTFAALAIATRGPGLSVRLALLAGSLLALYMLLVRGTWREALPPRQRA
jgi:O-antigen/teichoic acid export membrane protein